MMRWLTCWTVVLSLILSLKSDPCSAEAGTIHVVTHDRIRVVTDPTKGYKEYSSIGQFPLPDVAYRKVTLWVTYRCPDSLHCGEWDYIDGVYLRRRHTLDTGFQDIELARLISPYGRNFDAQWKFTWHVDITDFSLLLHDSVEIVFKHTGYESNTDRGWVITLDFALLEGRPAMTCLGMDSLWCGSFPYGDTAKPIEALLHPITFTAPSDAAIARLRIVQTGHGMDDSANCAEFCEKYRRVYFDSTLMNERTIWRTCGDNPLYPQAGTWIFNRANWCPGSMVAPDIYDFTVKPHSSHAVDIAMQPYVNPNHPSANYYIHSFLFYYKEPWAANDVSLEEILTPSGLDEYSRYNPICGQPQITVKNNGSHTVDRMTITYSATGGPDTSIQWLGALAPQHEATIELPGQLVGLPGENSFHVRLESPNGVADEYPDDNTLQSKIILPPVLPTKFVLVLRSNHDSTHNSYQITDASGSVVRERKLGSLLANTLYRDTLELQPGCYQLIVSDTAGDGLDFWFNPEGGYGFVRILSLDGKLVTSFLSDFGSSIRYSFRVGDTASLVAADITLPLVNPFPMRSKGIFSVELFFNEPHDTRLRVLNEDSSKIVYDSTYVGVKEAFLPVDISSAPDGTYWLKVSSDSATITRRIKVKHQD
ncbi:MAG: peptide-N-glycosidase F-related protein [Candidatus Zixiibacteriota bacterium]